MHVAARAGHYDAIRLLHSLGADINGINSVCYIIVMITTQSGCTPRQEATRNKHSETVKLLDVLGAKIDLRNIR